MNDDELNRLLAEAREAGDAILADQAELVRLGEQVDGNAWTEQAKKRLRAQQEAEAQAVWALQRLAALIHIDGQGIQTDTMSLLPPVVFDSLHRDGLVTVDWDHGPQLTRKGRDWVWRLLRLEDPPWGGPDG